MSLHALATNMASKGRNGDSMLVHMTPSEVHGLQALAMKHGGSLTTNPDTGLPEANFLKSLLPMLAGFALGPAGFGLVSSAMGAGAIVGGITGIATGSLSKGLMAGLGAYGGFGVGESLAGLGASEMSAQSISSAMPEYTGNAAEYADKVNALRAQTLSAANAPGAIPYMDKLSAGFSSASASPMDALGFAKNNMMPLAAAAAPIAADMMVPTATKMPTNLNPAYIRQYVAGDRPQAPRALDPVLATDWGSRNFQDAYRGANGGIVALAEGGMPRDEGGITALAAGGDAALAAYQSGDYATANRLLGEAGMSAQDVVSKYGLSQADAATVAKNLGYTGDMSGIQYAAPPPAAQAAPVTQAVEAPAYTQYTPEQMGSYLSNPVNQNVNLQEAIKTTNADPAAVNAYIASIADPFRGSTDTTGGSGVLGIYNRMVSEGIDPSEMYKAEIANDPKYAGYTQPMIQKAYDLSKGAYSLTDQIARDKVVADPVLGYDKQWVKYMDDNKYTVDDMAQAFGISRNEIAARVQKVRDAEAKTPPVVPPVVKPPIVKPPISVVPGATQMPGATVYDNGAFGNYGSGPATGVDYLGRTTSIATPGDIVTNPDGSRTVNPNLPGREPGGFTGIDQLKSAYTAGGGNLGYVSPVVKTAAAHDAAYNKQTDDSLDAYNYLIGKAGAKYPSKSRATEIMKPYEEAVLGYPTDPTKKKYINVGGKMVKNPEYKEPVSKITKTGDPDVVPKETPRTGYQWGWNQKDKKWEEIPITTTDTTQGGDGGGEAAGGLQQAYAMGGATGYAVGGGLGTLGGYSDGGRLLKGPGDGVSDSIPATIGRKQQPARLADGEFVVPARIVSELGNGSTDAGARKLYAMMDRVQKARGKTTGKKRVATDTRTEKYLPA